MEYYNEKRFQNWIKKIAESVVDESDASTFAVFDQMLEDIVIACLNIVRAVKDREIKKTDAVGEVSKIMSLLNKNYKFDSALKDEVFQFTLESIRAVLLSFQYYLEGKFSKKDFRSLLANAVSKEKDGDYESALDAIARMGAKIIKGERLPELDIPEDGVVLSWLDGIDAINAVLELNRIDAPAE
ncbi:DUF2150 domain-containing protein [Archaeoglobales archaeon]|nr:MAG: DUF2150 domain-containing protein [Archaeoglobales archaeon ex4484_92]RLI83244.1 MAG: DUF2150 domain-containing protein [Archaeoglobales archaeon]